MANEHIAVETVAMELYPDQLIGPQPELERRFINGRWDYVATDTVSFLSSGGTLDRSKQREEFVASGKLVISELQKRGISNISEIILE